MAPNGRLARNRETGNALSVGDEAQAGQEAEYKRKHDEIWPEMVELLKQQGIHNYTIYRHGLTLFAYFERDDDAAPRPGEPDAVALRWWKWMAPHMETHADLSPVTRAGRAGVSGSTERQLTSNRARRTGAIPSTSELARTLISDLEEVREDQEHRGVRHHQSDRGRRL